jgi:hypothetical protein
VPIAQCRGHSHTRPSFTGTLDVRGPLAGRHIAQPLLGVWWFSKPCRRGYIPTVKVALIIIWQEAFLITISAARTGKIACPAPGADFGCPTASVAGLLSLGT